MLNRLAKEKSPYLLQHKSNPVNWFSWGEEAFIEARRTNRPIFLSIGISIFIHRLFYLSLVSCDESGMF